MKIYSFLTIVLFVFIQSCGSEIESDPKVSEIQVPELTQDTTVTVAVEEPKPEISAHLQTILDKSDTTYFLPMAVDTNFIKVIDFNDKSDRTALNFENGQYLGARILESAPTFEGEYYMEVFCELDSLKSAGAYADYVNNLDIGMMQVADAFVEGIIDLGEGKHMLLWSINFSTYEACPYASGAAVYGTLLSNYEVQNTMLLAEVSGGGDPPAWGDTNVSTEITAEFEIETYSLNRSGEDEGPADIIEETYVTRIGDSGFEFADDY
jgi:hypothetical protein